MKGKRVLAVLAMLCLWAAPPATRAADRNDYANRAFTEPLTSGLEKFYARDFAAAEQFFEQALTVVPDNTLAISFLNAAAARRTGELDSLVDVEEDRVARSPKDYVAHVRLGFSYLFSSLLGHDRIEDARDELNSAVQLQPAGQAAHVGLGIMRFNDRSANRSKIEFLTALGSDRNNVLAREYLGELYQLDLRDPQRGLAYVIDVPNLVPAYADILFHIGSLLYDLKQHDAAIKYLTQGLELDTGHVGEAGQHALTLLARIYLDEKKLDAAKRALNAAVANDADAEYARTLLEKINNGDYDGKSGSGTTASVSK